MSLINEALKKAQRVRTGDTVGTMAPMPGGGSRVAKRSAPRTAQQLVLIAAGAIALVVLSVVATVFLVNRPADPKPTVAAAPKPAASAPSATAPASSPAIVVPMGAPAPAAADPLTSPPAPPTSSQSPAAKPTLPPPAPVTAPPPRTAAVASTPPDTKPALATPAPIPTTRPPTPSPAVEPAPAAPTPVAATPTTTAPPVPSTIVPGATPTLAPPTVAAERATPAPLPVAPSPPKLDERAILFVDAIKVAGVRASGNESRVLLNDRVFRVNEIVERNFGLRLTKVESNSLTFTDANGAVYIKHF